MEPGCKLKLHIPLNVINKIYKDLDESFEVSGVINFDNNNQVLGFNRNKGNSYSVYTPNNVINYHTHPISAYNNGRTVWGWPSGEDIRETIKFVLAGNKAHLVFTVEGLYTIQVSPCKIKKIKELLDPEERGVLIFLIEEYFKTTHNFRGTNEVNRLKSNKTLINPYSYTDFVNTFDLSNLLNTKTIYHKKSKNSDLSKNGHTGIHFRDTYSQVKSDTPFSRIPNIGFPEMQDNIITNSTLKDYISSDDLNDIRDITSKGGDSKMSKIKSIEKVISILNKLLIIFKTNPCKGTWNNNPNAWFFVNFFPSNHYLTKSHLNGNKYISPVKTDNFLNTEPFIRIFSNKSQGCSVNTIVKINNFKIGSGKNKENSSFGNAELSPRQRYLMYSLIFNSKNARDLMKKMGNGITIEQIENELSKIKKHVLI
jgi:hypothetical protein